MTDHKVIEPVKEIELTRDRDNFKSYKVYLHFVNGNVILWTTFLTRAKAFNFVKYHANRLNAVIVTDVKDRR